jgi:peptidoglycan-N-acetylglucosamine deacetylase
MRMNPWSIALPAMTGIAAGVAGVAAWGAVSRTSQLFGPALCRMPLSTQIALTFDDGPNPAATPQLLALLERRNVRATFFLVGKFVRACPDLVREISARGHMLGNHTETHPNLALASMRRVEDELSRCQESIAGALARVGAPADRLPKWLRPPFGYRLPHLWRAARRAGLCGIATWSFTAYDWKPQPPSKLIERLARVAKPAKRTESIARASANNGGEIVLLHDGDYEQLGAGRSHVLAALEHWLPRWQDAGFEFVTIDGAAGVPAEAS